MTRLESIFSKLGLPEGFGVVILVFSFILMLSPYFSGLDFGVFKVPIFSNKVAKKLKIIAPALFLIVIFLFVPILKPKTSKSTRSTSKLSKQVDTPTSITSTHKVISKNPDNKQRSSEQPKLPPLPKKKGQQLSNDTPNDIQVIFDIEKVSSHKPKIVYFSNFHNSIVFGDAFGDDTIDILGIWDTKTASILQEKDYSYFKSSIHPSIPAYF